ncbi:MAG: LysM peptidoglycan-binding domain-containing protein [Anaerolineae bacterium]|nr:LysM peptidoglycan-binding domain-containing protein [Anaerolineae bacterium]
MSIRYLSLVLLVVVLWLVGCSSQPQEIVVTRLVDRELVVTSEVTRIVSQVAQIEVRVEVPVEVTRLVEVTPVPTPEGELPAEPSATITPESAAVLTGTQYTVRSGDTLFSISTRTGISVADILSANNLTSASVIYTGQILLIPNWDGVDRVAAAPISPTQPPPPPPTTPGNPTGPNLFPNPSFEEDWYYAGYSELQIPVGWQVATDEGANTLSPGSGGLFYRPEIRVVPYYDLPAAEQQLFIFDGGKTLKAFKGHGPTSFSLFTDVGLPPGSYRLVIRYFADTVDSYVGASKIYSGEPLAGEMRVIHDNAGTGWQGTVAGQRGVVTYDFTVSAAATVRLGASFRNRYAIANNGWFLDHWELYALTP